MCFSCTTALFNSWIRLLRCWLVFYLYSKNSFTGSFHRDNQHIYKCVIINKEKWNGSYGEAFCKVRFVYYYYFSILELQLWKESLIRTGLQRNKTRRDVLLLFRITSSIIILINVTIRPYLIVKCECSRFYHSPSRENAGPQRAVCHSVPPCCEERVLPRHCGFGWTEVHDDAVSGQLGRSGERSYIGIFFFLEVWCD